MCNVASRGRTPRRTILITGASSGIGAEMARVYARAGHNLGLVARRLDKLQELQAALVESQSVRVEVRALDVNEADAVPAAFEALDRALGGIDRVIVNAGVGKGEAIGQGYVDSNLAIARTNFVGALTQVEAALALFRRREAGHLVLTGSVAGVRSLPGTLAAYSASKIALASVGRSLQVEYAGSPIRISVVQPGNMRTPLNAYRRKMQFEVDERTGAQAVVHAIGAERRTAFAPAWPWAAMALVMRIAPEWLLARSMPDDPP